MGQQGRGLQAETEHPYTLLGGCVHAYSMYPAPAKNHHALLSYTYARAASFAPEKIQEHPQAAFALALQLTETQSPGQSALSAAHGESNQPTRLGLLHTPTVRKLLFQGLACIWGTAHFQ